MIKEGCLEGVDEVYGYHNWPAFTMGHLLVKPGPVMAHTTELRITIEGKGGHGSQPQRRRRAPQQRLGGRRG